MFQQLIQFNRIFVTTCFRESLQGSYRVNRPEEAKTTSIASHMHTRDNQRYSLHIFFHNKQKPSRLTYIYIYISGIAQKSHPPHHYIAPSDESSSSARPPLRVQCCGRAKAPTSLKPRKRSTYNRRTSIGKTKQTNEHNAWRMSPGLILLPLTLLYHTTTPHYAPT